MSILISQLINDIPRVLQRLPIHFNGAILSTFFIPSSPVSFVIFSLNLNKILLLSLSLLLLLSLFFGERSIILLVLF